MFKLLLELLNIKHPAGGYVHFNEAENTWKSNIKLFQSLLLTE